MAGLNDGDLLDAVRQAELVDVVRRGLNSPGKPVEIPQAISDQLNARLTNALVPEILAVRARERTVSTETLRMTLR